MSKQFLLTLQPMEPYFLGNEKTFSFDPKKPEDNRYFIKGERMPLQTTLLGALRFLLMPVKNSDYTYTDDEQARNIAIIGAASFQIEGGAQNFGAIESISPVFLLHDGQRYVRTPLDHQAQIKDRYTPLSGEVEVETDQGKRWFFPEFHAKIGICDSYMNVEDGTLAQSEDVFLHTVRVGVSKGKQEKGFFKKQFVRMADGWSFGTYVSLNTDLIGSDPSAASALSALESGTIVYLGQSKSAFSVRIRQAENDMYPKIARLLRPGVVYCLGDAKVDRQTYAGCLFAVTQTRDYRAYRTTYTQPADGARLTARIAKGASLYKLLCAGSVLIPDPEKNIKPYFQSENCRKIGCNITIPNWED